MSYSRENILAVTAEFSDKRAAAIERAKSLERELYEKYPDIREVDEALSKTAMKIFDEICAGSENIDERVAKVREENELLQKKRAELLALYGYDKDYTEVKYECPKCKDTGYIGYKTCECFKKALTLAAYKSSGIGNLLEKQSFENFSLSYYNEESRPRIEKNLEFCKAYAESFDPAHAQNLLLFGGTGLGKTHLTTAMAARIIDRGYEVVYESSGGIFREFEKERFEKGEGAFTERFYDAELLIIDDLGTEMVNQFTVSTLYDLINTRMIKGRPTVISTNLTSEDMRKKYTDRIVSRLFGEYTVLLFVGKDVRMQKIQKGIR